MANPYIIKAQDGIEISGNTSIIGNTTITGSISTTAGITIPSGYTLIGTASYAQTASYSNTLGTSLSQSAGTNTVELVSSDGTILSTVTVDYVNWSNNASIAGYASNAANAGNAASVYITPTFTPGDIVVALVNTSGFYSGIYYSPNLSYNTGSNTLNVTASYALTASYAMNGGGSNSEIGIVTLNFGSPPGTNITTASILTSNVNNNSSINIYIMNTSSIDHNTADHQLFALYSKVIPGEIIDNTSFVITCISDLRINGTFNAKYIINN